MMSVFFKALVIAISNALVTIMVRLDRVVSYIIHLISTNVHDADVMPLFGDQHISPVFVAIDREPFTNKFNMMAQWKWDTDVGMMGGIRLSDLELLKPGFKTALIFYHQLPIVHDNLTVCVIDSEKRKVFFNGKPDIILFNEIPFI